MTLIKASSWYHVLLESYTLTLKDTFLHIHSVIIVCTSTIKILQNCGLGGVALHREFILMVIRTDDR